MLLRVCRMLIGTMRAVVARTNADWWVCRAADGRQGFAPVSYLDLPDNDSTTGASADAGTDTDTDVDTGTGTDDADVVPGADSDDRAWQHDEYFRSYAHLKIHHEMLSDAPRTEAYRRALDRAAPFLRSAVTDGG